VTGIGKSGKWQRAMIVATGVGTLGAFLTAPLAEAAMVAPVAQHAVFRLQDAASYPPSQVGEGDADNETLDQGSPPAAAGDDVETLDQGSPPAVTSAAPVPVTDGTVLTAAPVAAPATTDTAYSAPAGPQLPPGFGEGRVMVSNNPRGFPVGLEPCEVGVVSGRAYVGVHCGDSSTPVVGHSTYQDFPWVIDPGFPFDPGADVVTDPSFPFDEDSPFFESTLDRTTDSDVVVMVAPRGFPFDDNEESDDTNADTTDATDSTDEAPAVSTGGSVSLTQPVKTDKERNRERTRTSGSASSGDVSSDPGKSQAHRSTAKQQRAKVGSESHRGKHSGAKHGHKAKSNKKHHGKGANKESQKQRARSEKHEKRHKNR